jgi:hypothetical protein
MPQEDSESDQECSAHEKWRGKHCKVVEHQRDPLSAAILDAKRDTGRADLSLLQKALAQLLA